MIAALRTPILAHNHGYRGRIGRIAWRATDYYIQIYLDDILILTIHKERMQEVIGAIQELFNDLGILCHPHKCELTPTERIDFLGMRLHIPEARFYLTDR